MIIDATFWVAVSFLIFVIILIYFKIPSKVKTLLDENINQIRKQIEESEKLKEEAKNKLAEYEKKIVGSKSEIQKMIRNAKPNNIFDDEILNLMDFNCDQRNDVHFFYTLPFSKNRALVETTWLSTLEDRSLMDYDLQLENYIENNLGIKNYKINFTEKGAIPLFHPSIKKNKKSINIGSAGSMTRLSTGYTFLNIQEHSRYIRKNLEKIESKKEYKLGKKYEFLDKIFLNVLKKNPEKMPLIFSKLFQNSANTIIKFLSNKSNIFDDLKIISKMPKIIFLKALFNR